MKITEFKINADATAIVLKLEDATNVTSLDLWKGSDYKDYSKKISLVNKLNSSAIQTIEITLADINEPEFNGLYYLEVGDTISTLQAIEVYDIKYKECILGKLSDFQLCDECLKKESLSLINSQTLLVGLNYAADEGFIEESLEILKALEKYCSNTCKTCGGYNNIINNNYYDYNSN